MFLYVFNILTRFNKNWKSVERATQPHIKRHRLSLVKLRAKNMIIHLKNKSLIYKVLQ